MLYGNLMKRHIIPLQLALGLTKPSKVGRSLQSPGGKPKLTGRYGLHSARHFGASLWIHNRVNLKRLQTWMGHADIATTMNIYGHLIEELEDEAAIALAAQEQVSGSVSPQDPISEEDD